MCSCKNSFLVNIFPQVRHECKLPPLPPRPTDASSPAGGTGRASSCSYLHRTTTKCGGITCARATVNSKNKTNMYKYRGRNEVTRPSPSGRRATSSFVAKQFFGERDDPGTNPRVLVLTGDRYYHVQHSTLIKHCKCAKPRVFHSGGNRTYSGV